MTIEEMQKAMDFIAINVVKQQIRKGRNWKP
jgi:hypothetical protein